MTAFLDLLDFIFAWGYTFVFFWIIRTFIPLRANLLLKITAFFVCGYLADSIIYANDAGSLFGTMAGFFAFVLIFYRGTFMEKLSVLLVFYPALIAINYLMLDIGGRIFKAMTHATYEETLVSPELTLISTEIHTFSLFLRLLFWVVAWLVLRRFLSRITSHLTLRMWLIVDMLILASFVAIFTILYFMPEDTLISYPICGASIFSSFGCMYLASYICDSMQTAYRAQELQMQKDYYKDRIRDKSAKAREKHIDFNAVIHFGNGDFMDPLDISTIFGNAIDNAIEASEKLPEDRRLITVKAAKVRDMLMITAENNMEPGGQPHDGTSKNDRFLHGFGIPNIRKAAEKYDGQCSISAKDGIFRLKVLIPV